MKQKAVLLLSVLLIMSSFLVYVTITDAASENESETISIELDYSDNAPDFKNKEVKALHEEKFELNNHADSKINIDLNIEQNQEDKNYVEARGTFEAEGKTYSFSYNGEIDTHEYNYAEFLQGPLEGEIQTAEGKKFSMMGLYYDPDTQEATATISVGRLGDKEPVTMYFFGNASKEAVANLESLKTNNNDLGVEEESNEQHTENEDIKIQDSETYNYIGTTTTILFNWDDDWGYLSPFSGVVAQATDWFEIDRDDTEIRKVRARIFSNSQAIKRYFMETYDIPEELTEASPVAVEFGLNGSNVVHIHEVTPEEEFEEFRAALPWYVQMLVDGTPVGDAFKIFANIFEGQKVIVEHDSSRDPVTENINSYTVTINRGSGDNYWTDYSSDPDNLKRSLATQEEDGGVTAVFFYNVTSGGDYWLRGHSYVTYGVHAFNEFHGYVQTGYMSMGW